MKGCTELRVSTLQIESTLVDYVSSLVSQQRNEVCHPCLSLLGKWKENLKFKIFYHKIQ